MENRSRTLYFKRASWADTAAPTLEQVLQDTHRIRATTQDRHFQYSEGQIEGIAFEENGGFFCHVVAFHHEQPTSLVPVPSGDPADTTLEQDPPGDYDFMDAGISEALTSEAHRRTRTYGGRNTPAQIQEDALDLDAAQKLDETDLDKIR